MPTSSNVKKPIRIINPYVIAIPSYQRPDMLFKKTLTTLDKLLQRLPTTLNSNPTFWLTSPEKKGTKIERGRDFRGTGDLPVPAVYIFLANDTELVNYRQEYKHFIQHHPKIGRFIKFIIGVPGLVAQRNFIMNWFMPGQYIIGMDDDVEGIYKLNTHGNPSYKARRTWTLDHLKPGELHELALTGFKMLQEHGAHLWGIHPVDNPYFMSAGMSTDLRFIVGPFYGIINRPKLVLTTPAKDNVERTLQNYKADGTVIRFNYITLRTQYYKNKGGLQAVNIGNARREKARMAMEYLHTKYPEYTVIHITKKNKWPELKLINKTKKSRIKKLVNNKHNA